MLCTGEEGRVGGRDGNNEARDFGPVKSPSNKSIAAVFLLQSLDWLPKV